MKTPQFTPEESTLFQIKFPQAEKIADDVIILTIQSKIEHYRGDGKFDLAIVKSEDDKIHIYEGVVPVNEDDITPEQAIKNIVDGLDNEDVGVLPFDNMDEVIDYLADGRFGSFESIRYCRLRNQAIKLLPESHVYWSLKREAGNQPNNGEEAQSKTPNQRAAAALTNLIESCVNPMINDDEGKGQYDEIICGLCGIEVDDIKEMVFNIKNHRSLNDVNKIYQDRFKVDIISLGETLIKEAVEAEKMMEIK